MTIDKIGPLNKILKTQSDLKIKKSQKTKGKDSVELSEQAKKMAEISQAIDKVKQSPEIRKDLTPERIKALREKLKDPDAYLTKEIAEQIADKVLESFGIKSSE
ncbi:MAG: flagellar biosynthesis anti-sigma factor FlgM [Spirochaetota bacterium]